MYTQLARHPITDVYHLPEGRSSEPNRRMGRGPRAGCRRSVIMSFYPRASNLSILVIELEAVLILAGAIVPQRATQAGNKSRDESDEADRVSGTSV